MIEFFFVYLLLLSRLFHMLHCMVFLFFSFYFLCVQSILSLSLTHSTLHTLDSFSRSLVVLFFYKFIKHSYKDNQVELRAMSTGQLNGEWILAIEEKTMWRTRANREKKTTTRLHENAKSD